MNNFSEFEEMISDYLKANGIMLEVISNLHDASLNKAESQYIYDGKRDLDILDMDLIAKSGYKIIKDAEGVDNIINTSDAFVINKDNQWYFIEFKDEELSAKNNSLKNGVLKKAYANWYMLLDILYFMNKCGKSYSKFSLNDPITFAKKNVHYILVCSSAKNPSLYVQVKNCESTGTKYTPPFMQRLKDYMFKDAYVYTEQFLERKFVKNFKY